MFVMELLKDLWIINNIVFQLWGAMWGPALLLGLFTVCSCVDQECVVGIVGHPVLLPCYPHTDLQGLQNVTLEWREDGEEVLKAQWRQDGNVLVWSVNSASIPNDALLTGNLSLSLPRVSPKENQRVYSLVLTAAGNGSLLLCSMCLRTAARFSSPLLQRDGPALFWCRSSGGFPEPTVSWLINDTEQPPEDSVWTRVEPVPDSNLYNVTSQLSVNISSDDSVSCSISNQWTNETLTSRSSGEADDTFRSRASEGMWMFSTGLCVAVGIMVGVGVAYQIHLDRISKKRRVLYESTKAQRVRRKHQFLEETEEEMLTSKETSV